MVVKTFCSTSVYNLQCKESIILQTKHLVLGVGLGISFICTCIYGCLKSNKAYFLVNNRLFKFSQLVYKAQVIIILNIHLSNLSSSIAFDKIAVFTS